MKASQKIKTDYKTVMDELFQENEWKKHGSAINSNINNFNNLKNYLKNAIEEKSEKQNEKDIETVENYLNDLKGNIEPLIYQTLEKVKYYQLEENIEKKEDNDNNDSQSQGNILIYDLTQNTEILEKKRKDLESIYETSAKIKDITDVMAKNLEQQGAILDDVEANVINAEQNAKKAKEEITKAEQLSRGNRKKLICLIIIVFIAIIGITSILLALIFG